MIKNESDLFKEKIELFIQMSTVEAQFERLLKIYRLNAQKRFRTVVKMGESDERWLTFYQKSNIILYAEGTLRLI